MEEAAPTKPVVPPTKTPSAKKTTWTDVLNGIIYMALSVAAIYYGWIFGQKYALKYWMIVQVIGTTLQTYILKMIASIRQFASKQVQ